MGFWITNHSDFHWTTNSIQTSDPKSDLVSTGDGTFDFKANPLLLLFLFINLVHHGICVQSVIAAIRCSGQQVLRFNTDNGDPTANDCHQPCCHAIAQSHSSIFLVHYSSPRHTTDCTQRDFVSALDITGRSTDSRC